MTTTLTLPRKHTMDWHDRCYNDEDMTIKFTKVGQRTVTVELDDAALKDLISDSTYYAEEMGPDSTGDGMDYRAAARRVLASLTKQGVSWEIKHFRVTLL